MTCSIKRRLQIVSCLLIVSIICGILPWRELRADADTHGDYESYPFTITYEQNSTWNNSTQGQYTLTNISDYEVSSWILEIDYFEDVTLSNIWNATDVTDYETDENIKVSGNVSIPAGGTYSFGLIADGTETAPVSPISVNVIQYESDDPDVTPTTEPTPEITEEPTPTEEIVPTEEPIVTEVPIPTEDAEPTVFPYAIFAGSTEADFSFQGWKSNITGDIYSGRDFLYQGSELHMEGYARTVGTVQPAGWITEMTGVEEGIDPLPIPDWAEAIAAKESLMPTIAPEFLTSQDSIVANGYYYSEDDITINGTDFTGDAVIISRGNITYNVDSLNADEEITGRILLYSEEGHITINGTRIGINGILYAPQGSVSINAYDTTINGRIVADQFSYSGSILNVTADPSDLELVYDLPDVNVTALQSQVYIGSTATFRIEIPKDNVYEIRYRLNGEEVQVEDPVNEDGPRFFNFIADTEGTYTFEAYVVLPYGEYVLDSASVTIVSEPTPSPTSTPEPTATSTPTPEPTATNTPTPTSTPTSTPTATPEPTATSTPTPTDTPTSTPTNTSVPTDTETPTVIPTVEPTVTDTPTVIPTETPTPIPTEITTVTPTPTEEPTPTPTTIPDEEGYYIFSQGESRICGYRDPFAQDQWRLYEGAILSDTELSLRNSILDGDASAFFLGERSFSPDHSLSGRFTVSVNRAMRLEDMVNTFEFCLYANDSDATTNSISIWLDPVSGQISLLRNRDRENPVATGYFLSLTSRQTYNDIWFDYDGQTHTFNVYAAKYSVIGEVYKPQDPVLSCEIDLSEVFEGNDSFSWFYVLNCWMASVVVIRGVELDPNPAIHQSVTPTPTPEPVSNGFVEFSQGNTEYGYETSFVEEDWNCDGESCYLSEDEISLVNTDTDLRYGSSFLSFTEDVGDDFEFYTRFTFSQDDAISNGLAFVIEPYCDQRPFWGTIGYNMHHPGVIVEFDFDPQNGYYALDESGEFSGYSESNSHVGIIVNGNEEQHYSVADYRFMRTTERITDAWVDYDGQTLKVYVCTMNEYGHIYKYEEPIVSVDIDLEELFGGASILNMGFIAGDSSNTSNVILNGFAIAQDPFTTLLPEEILPSEQDIYQIVSIGDPTYGYENRFNPEDWNGDQGRISANGIVIASDMYDFNQYIYTDPRVVPEDYSFSGRFTASICGSDPCHYMNFVLTSSPEDRHHSICIHLDTWQSGSAHWRNEFGEYIEGEEDGWYSGTEPFESMVSVCINGNERYDYAIAEYMPLREDGAVHEIWFNYDGTEQKLYVYIATYDEDGNVTRPATPIIVCPLDLEEIFEGSHELYPAFYGQTSLWDYGDYLTYGFEFDPWPEIHNDFGGVLQVIAPLDNRVYTIGDSIDISGRIGDEADPDTGCSVTLLDSMGETVYENEGTVDEDFGYIDRIDTTDMDPGTYTIVLTVTDSDGNDYIREIPITLRLEAVITAELTGIQISDDGIDITGSISCNEDSSYELQVFDEETEEWTTISEGEGNKENEVLGTLLTEGLESGIYRIKLIVTSESGITYDTGYEIEYTAPEREYTDEELFVDINDDQNGNEITFITDITGTVSGTELQNYTFEVFAVGSEEPVFSSDGTDAVDNGTLGTVDATLLMNGYYRIVVTAFAEDGSIEDEVTVLVTGNAKIGNFTISFLDMTLPVAGLPVEVYRTYDSRQRSEAGDFGYGWTMSVGGPSISFSGDLSDGWTYESRSTLMFPANYWTGEHPHEVYIDWGNGSSEVFELQLTPDGWIDNIPDQIQAGFTNTSGRSDTLTILDESCSGLTYGQTEGILYGEDLERFAPQNFLLTRYDGIKFYFNIDTGLYRIEDTYGRTIDISDSGIVYSDGGSINFNRNEDGVITSITDGLGNEVTYSYNENGDLVRVNDIGGYNTSFEYDESHYITLIRDSEERGISRNEYDDDGRLVATVDAYNNRIEFSHDLDGKVEVTTDRRGFSTVYYYDDRGNVVHVHYAEGNDVYYGYDEHNNKISETRADGTTYTYSYDSNGNLLTASDDHGRNIASTYGSNGELLTMSAMGVTELTMAYDEHGNLITATDSSGNTQNYGYSNTGELTSVTDSLGTLMSMVYDGSGHLISLTNAEGQVTNFSYDNEGRLVTRSITYQGATRTDTYSYDDANRVSSVTYANNNTVSYTYNQAGDVVCSTDSQNRRVFYTYDLYGNLTHIDYPDNTFESFTYDAEGNNISATDRMGRTVRFVYDRFGNCTSKIYGNGSSETFEYDVCNRLVHATNVYGAETFYSYDYLGRNTAITDNEGNTTSYTYNDRGNVASVTDARGNTYSFTYDNNGNQTSVTYPNGSVFSSSYDVRGRLTSQSDAYGNTTTYSYDSMDRLVSVTDALGGTWSYGYDTLGNITSVTDANENTTTYGYDLNGQVTSVTNAAGNTATTTYDQYGRVISSTDFGGVETVYTYDSMDRVVTETTNGEVTTYEYTGEGLLSCVTDPTGTVSYTYNERGFLASVTNANGETISYEYNLGDQLSKITIDGRNICYGYDIMGRLVTVTDSEGTTRYTYDEVGNRASTTYPNGVVTTYTYNDINALISQVTTDSTGTVLANYEYTVGANGERLSVTELGRTVEYTYDQLNRLTSETVMVGDDVYETTYTYDSNSNRLSMTRNGETTTYEYNELNQITRAGDIDYTWDNAGNLISQSSMGITAATYSYDCHNRMISASVNTLQGTIEETYTYDYLGNRTSKTTDGETTYFTTDLSSGYSQVLKATTGTEDIYYTRGFELISRRVGTDASYYLYDGGLSVRGLTDEDGVLTDAIVFDAFGNETERTGTTDNSYGFQGEEQDSTGLYYLRARYMDPSTGTFTTMDTYGGNIFDPVSLHKYLFANANPVMYCDPSGHSANMTDLALALGVHAIIGAELDAIFYVFGVNCGDEPQPYSNTDFFCNIFAHMCEGASFGILLNYIELLTSLFLIAKVVLDILLILSGLASGNQAINDIKTGDRDHIIRGVFEGLTSIFMIIGGINGLRSDIHNVNQLRDRVSSRGIYYDSDTIDSEIEAFFGGESGPVEFSAPPNATLEEIAQVEAYVNGCNEAMWNGQLSPTGRVSTRGALRDEANAAARIERLNNVYYGVVGHLPDCTWTGIPIPYRWIDMSGRVNSSLGGQCNKYPIGYKPTIFIFQR